MSPTDSEVIDRLGGPTAIAKQCETTPQAVSQWRTSGIPKAWRKYLMLLHPGVFERSTQPASAGQEPSDAA